MKKRHILFKVPITAQETTSFTVLLIQGTKGLYRERACNSFNSEIKSVTIFSNTRCYCRNWTDTNVTTNSLR